VTASRSRVRRSSGIMVAVAHAPAAVHIRPVRPNEHRAVGELTVRAYRQLKSDLGAYERLLRNVADRAARASVLVATAGRELAGTVTYVGGPGPYAEGDDPDAAWIRMLAVVPEWQRRGIGEALVRECIALAARDGRCRVLLHTTMLMVTAHRLYQRLGFRRAPELDQTPSPGLTLAAYAFEARA
jgi:ribosomal protein S18 acetylase RimI-like enzyme